MAKRADPNKSIFELIDFANRECPKYARNFERWLRIVTPAIATRFPTEALPVPDEMVDWVSVYKQIPARLLCEALDWSKKGKAYSDWIIEAVPELSLIEAYRTDYRKAGAHALKRAFDTHFLSRAHIGVAPGWIDALTVLDDLPFTNPRLEAYKECGETEFCGILIAERPDRVKLYAAQVRDATNVLARTMTALGIKSPHGVAASNLYGAADSFYAQTLERNPNAGHVVSKARYGWQRMQRHFPNLVNWPEPQKARTYSPTKAERAPMLRAMLLEIETVLKAGDRGDVTLKNIDQSLVKLVGFHMNTMGRSFDQLWSDPDVSPSDLAWILLAGRAPKKGRRVIASAREIELSLSDKEHREELLESLPVINQEHAGAGQSRANPFVEEFVNKLIVSQKAASATMVLYAVKMVLAEYLEVHETQLAWIESLARKAFTAGRK